MCEYCNDKIWIENDEYEWILEEGWICSNCVNEITIKMCKITILKKIKNIYQDLKDNNDDELKKNVDYNNRIKEIFNMCLLKKKHSEDFIIKMLCM